MFQFLKMCWRDLWRNTRRTVLTGLVMSFSVTLLLFAVALGDGGHDKMIRASTDSFLGHGQIQDSKWRDEPSLENVLDADEVILARSAIKDIDGIVEVSPRISAGGLLSKKIPEPDDPNDMEAWRKMVSEGVFMLGVNPETEARVSNLDTSLQADQPSGRCINGCVAARQEVGADNSKCQAICATSEDGFEGQECEKAAARICTGSCAPDDEFCDEKACLTRFNDYCEPARFLAPVDPYQDNPYRGEAVLGATLAKVLDVGVGDLVAMTTGTARGRSFGSLYRVAGLIRSGNTEINRFFALTHIDKLSQGLEIPGAATQMIVAVENLDKIDGITADMKKALAANPEIEALSWKEISPELDAFMKLDQGSMMVMLVLMVMVVAVLLANVVIMAGMERTREYGIRLAMGEPPSRITGGLIIETALLALVSGLLGLAVGETLIWVFSFIPFDFGMGEMETSGFVVDTVFFTKFSVYGIVFSLGSVWFFAMIGALIPSFRVRKLRPVQAIRFV